MLQLFRVGSPLALELLRVCDVESPKPQRAGQVEMDVLIEQ
jgi:hypothetical protein